MDGRKSFRKEYIWPQRLQGVRQLFGFVKAKRCGMIPPNFHKKRTHIHIIQSIKEHRSV